MSRRLLKGGRTMNEISEEIAEVTLQENENLNERIEQLEASVRALSEENATLNEKINELNKLPKFSVPTAKADGFGVIREIFRKK